MFKGMSHKDKQEWVKFSLAKKLAAAAAVKAHDDFCFGGTPKEIKNQEGRGHNFGHYGYANFE